MHSVPILVFLIWSDHCKQSREYCTRHWKVWHGTVITIKFPVLFEPSVKWTSRSDDWQNCKIYLHARFWKYSSEQERYITALVEFTLFWEKQENSTLTSAVQIMINTAKEWKHGVRQREGKSGQGKYSRRRQHLKDWETS